MKATVKSWHRIDSRAIPCELGANWSPHTLGRPAAFRVVASRRRQSDPGGPNERLELELSPEDARELWASLGRFLAVVQPEGRRS